MAEFLPDADWAERICCINTSVPLAGKQMQKLTGRHTNTETGRSDAGKLRATGMSGVPVFKRQDVRQGCVATQKDSLGPAGLRSHRRNGHTPGKNSPRHGAPLHTGITLRNLIRRNVKPARYVLRMQAHWCQSLDAMFWKVSVSMTSVLGYQT